MAVNKVTDITIQGYSRGSVPDVTEALRLYVAQELQELENTIRSVIEGSVQVLDNPPDNPKKGMVRYAVSPWDPLGNGTEGLMVYNGTAWVQV